MENEQRDISLEKKVPSTTKILQDGCETKRVPPAPEKASSSSLRYSSSSSSSVILDAWRPLRKLAQVTGHATELPSYITWKSNPKAPRSAFKKL